MRAASERGFAREGSSASCSAVDFQETNELQFSSTQGVFCETVSRADLLTNTDAITVIDCRPACCSDTPSSSLLLVNGLLADLPAFAVVAVCLVCACVCKGMQG